MDQQTSAVHPTPRVSIVVPVKNEAPNIRPLIEEIERACAALAPFETVYVESIGDAAWMTETTSERACN